MDTHTLCSKRDKSTPHIKHKMKLFESEQDFCLKSIQGPLRPPSPLLWWCGLCVGAQPARWQRRWAAAAAELPALRTQRLPRWEHWMLRKQIAAIAAVMRSDHSQNKAARVLV